MLLPSDFKPQIKKLINQSTHQQLDLKSKKYKKNLDSLSLKKLVDKLNLKTNKSPKKSYQNIVNF